MNELILPSIKMDNPNDPVSIYEGLADVKFNNWEESVGIKIFQSWFPTNEIIFSFKIRTSLISLFESIGKTIDIKAEGYSSWKATVSEIKENGEAFYSGYLNPPIISGDIIAKVKRLEFCLFNFRTYSGNMVKVSEKSFRTGEFTFETADHSILIHSIKDSKEQEEAQRKIGGYIFTNAGRIEFKESASYEKVEFLRKRLGLFLSFINGRRSYPRYIKAYSGSGNLLWKDYTPYYVEQYRYVGSWMPLKIKTPFADLWLNFLFITKNDDDFEKIGLVIHWYLEALNNSGHSIGSIFMLQTAFEILYNWLVEEEGSVKPYTEHTREKTYASNKLRTLLSHFELNLDLPDIYSSFFEGIYLIDRKTGKDKNPPYDFSYWYTETRNMFVHFSKVDGDNQKKLPENFEWYLLNTGLFNLEIILLKMMKYDGIITSRLQINKWSGTDQVQVNSPYISVSLK